MTGLFIIFTLLTIGFAAGYVTRGVISRRRHVEYLRLQPYMSSTLRPGQPSPDEGTRHVASKPSMPARRRTSNDITQSFQEIHIASSKLARPLRSAATNLHLVQSDRQEPDTGSMQPANADHSLEELVALLLRRKQKS
jgi:hypothetical protein